MKVFLLSLLLGSSAWALTYKPVEWPFVEGSQLRLKGFNGRVVFKQKKTGGPVKIFLRWEEKGLSEEELALWRPSIKKEKKLLVISVKEPLEKEYWKSPRKRYPQLVAEIWAPARSLGVSVYLKKGSVVFQGWEGEGQVNLHEGKVLISDYKGAIKVYQYRGQVQVQKLEGGPVYLNAYKSQMKISRVKGDLHVHNFSGSTQVAQSEGRLELSSFEGRSEVKRLKGDFEFKGGRSIISAAFVEGAVTGSSLQGKISLTLKDKVRVRVRTEDAPVTLRLKKSGAWVNLGTEEGKLYVPDFLKLTRYAQLKLRQGRLRGGPSSGSVFVRTKNGDIRLIY